MNFSIENFRESNLSPNAYLLLYSFVLDDLELTKHIHNKIGESEYRIAYFELQELGYIKLSAEEIWVPRQKLLSLRNSINPEPQFERFWKGYHEYAKQFYSSFKATDKTPAEKHWKKLTKAEKQLALDNYKLFIDSSSERNIFLKKARTYLGDKNFNDEFETKKSNKSSTEMI